MATQAVPPPYEEALQMEERLNTRVGEPNVETQQPIRRHNLCTMAFGISFTQIIMSILILLASIVLLILGSGRSFYEYGGYGIGGIIGALLVFTAGFLGVMSTRNTDNKWYRIGSLVFNIVAIFLAFINVILFTIAVLFLNTCSSVGGLDKLNFGSSFGITVTLDGCNSYKAGTGVAATLIFLHVLEFFLALVAACASCCAGCCKKRSQITSEAYQPSQRDLQYINNQSQNTQQMSHQQQQMSPNSQTAQQQIFTNSQLPQHQQSQYVQNRNRNGILQNQTVPQNLIQQHTPPQPQTAYYAVKKPEGTYYYPYQVMAPQAGQTMATSSLQSMQPMPVQYSYSNQNIQPNISQSGVAQSQQNVNIQTTQFPQTSNMQAAQIPQTSNIQTTQFPQTSNIQTTQFPQTSNIQNGQITQPTVSQASQIPLNMQGAHPVVLQLPNNQQIQGYLYIPDNQQSILQSSQQSTLQNSQQNIQQNTGQNSQQDVLQNVQPNISQNNEPNILQNSQSVTPTLHNVTTATQDQTNVPHSQGTANVAYSTEQNSEGSEVSVGSEEQNNTDSMVQPLIIP